VKIRVEAVEMYPEMSINHAEVIDFGHDVPDDLARTVFDAERALIEAQRALLRWMIEHGIDDTDVRMLAVAYEVIAPKGGLLA
jgi:hypothetical protein